jgi:hypothetical protein
MAISFVQSAAGGTNSGTSVNLTWPGNTTTGNFIILTFIHTSERASSISDSQSNNYVPITSLVANDAVDVYCVRNLIGGTTPTITITYGTAGQANAIAFEYSGVDPSSPASAYGTANGTNTTASASFSSVEAVETVVACLCSATSPTKGAGYGNYVEQLADGSTLTAAMQDKSETVPGTRTGTFTGTTSNWTMALIGLTPKRVDKVLKNFYLKQGFS